MIEALPGFPSQVVAFAGTGHITKQDYETVLIPAVEKAFEHQKKVRLYYQIGPGFSGIEAGAMWDDFKAGMEHILSWDRVAVVTDVDWIRYTIKAFTFMLPATVKLFRLNEETTAREWIAEGMTS